MSTNRKKSYKQNTQQNVCVFITYTTQYIQNVAARLKRFVANATDGKSDHIAEHKGQTDKLQYQTDRKQFRNGMLLYAYRIQLQRHQYQVDGKEYQIHAEYILLVKRKMKGQRIG